MMKINEDKTVVDLDIAIQYANDRHDGQMYGDKPYAFHLDQVLNNCQELGLNIECQIVSVLHDILEDTCHTDEEFITIYSEIRKMFGSKIAYHVGILTSYKPREDYWEYLDRVKQYSVATDVKLCDIIANLEASIISGDKRRIKKYKKALFNLIGD